VVDEDGRGILREILTESTRLAYSIVNVATRQLEHRVRGAAAVAVTLEVQGQPTAEPLAAGLTELAGVLEVAATGLAD
jgi:hypothetical protein